MSKIQRTAFHQIDIKFLIILALAIASFTTVTISPPWDMLGYMSQALNLIHGHGYTSMEGEKIFYRAPAFALMIAGAYKVFGISPESAFHIVRLFSIANPVLLYFLGKKLINAHVGFVSAILVLTSYSMNAWSYRHIDAIWPFFVILHCLLLYLGFERRKAYFFTLAGISLGIAYLTKEVSLLFIPLGPLMWLWIKEYRTAFNLRQVIGCLTLFSLTILPWVIYLWQNQALPFLWGTGGSVVVNDMGVVKLESAGLVQYWLQALQQYGSAFIAFYYADSRNTVAANFRIAPLFILAWIFIIVRSSLGDKTAKVIALNILLFLPIIYFIGKNHWRFGQVWHTMLVSYLALAYMLYACLDWLRKWRKSQNVATWAALYIATALIFLIQLHGGSRFDKGYKSIIKNSLAYSYIKGKSTDLKITGEFSKPYLDAIIARLIQVREINDGVLFNFYKTARVSFLKTNGSPNLFMFQKATYTNLGLKTYKEKVKKATNEQSFILWGYHRTDDHRIELYIMSELDLIDQIAERNIKYILLSPRFSIHEKYFSASDNFEKILSVGPKDKPAKNYHLYRVKDEPKVGQPSRLFISERLKKSLKLMRNEYPDKYRRLIDGLSSSNLGLTSDLIENALAQE